MFVNRCSEESRNVNDLSRLSFRAALVKVVSNCFGRGLVHDNSDAVDPHRQALTGLRPDEREVLLLRQNSDLTYDEIAVKGRAPVGTVKTQMRAALHKLRAVLGHD